MGNDHSSVSGNGVNGNVFTDKCNVAECNIVENIPDTLLQSREDAIQRGKFEGTTRDRDRHFSVHNRDRSSVKLLATFMPLTIMTVMMMVMMVMGMVSVLFMFAMIEMLVVVFPGRGSIYRMGMGMGMGSLKKHGPGVGPIGRFRRGWKLRGVVTAEPAPTATSVIWRCQNGETRPRL
jgi:hypothetical protein